MPIIKSAKKRVKTTKKATVRNARTKRNLRSALKTFTKSLGTSKSKDAHSKAQSAVAKAGKKKVIHKNKVARKQRQLAAAAKKHAGTKAAPAKKTAAKKTTVKKAAPKKTAARKPAAKKSSKK